jgi:DNA-binding IclR family transcriptional regulator
MNSPVTAPHRSGLPPWALQRVVAVLESEHRAGRGASNTAHVARRAGLSKSLTRRCLHVIRQVNFVAEQPVT